MTTGKPTLQLVIEEAAELKVVAQVGLRVFWGIGLYLHDMSSVHTVPAVIVAVENRQDRIPGGPVGQVDQVTNLIEVRFEYVADIKRTSTSVSFLCGACKPSDLKELFGDAPLQSLVGRTATAYVSSINPARAYLFLPGARVLVLEALKAVAWILFTSFIVIVGGLCFFKESQDE